MQRHNVPFIVSRICASVGCGILSSITFAVRICPFWQNPHCGTCSSIQACCSGCNLPFDASPSSVVTSPLTEEVGMTHDRTAAPLMITVHAPHCPRPHPNLGPCRPRSLRRTYSSGVAGSTSTVWDPPFTFSVILLIHPSLYLASGFGQDYQPGRMPLATMVPRPFDPSQQNSGETPAQAGERQGSRTTSGRR